LGCLPRQEILATCLVFIILFFLLEAQRALLRDVQTLTLYRGQYTTGRRSSPVPQLQCIGGTAAGKFSPKSVQCYNRGFDGRDVQWECKAEMSNDFQFGRVRFFVRVFKAGLGMKKNENQKNAKKIRFSTQK
jgi:hypothetical protein